MTNTCEIVRGKSDAAFHLSCETPRLFRDLSESISKPVEHRAQSPVHKFMLGAWPSITEGFSTDVHVIYTINVTNTCEIVRGKSEAVFRLGQETLQSPLESICKLAKHRAKSPIHKFMLVVWPSITKGFPTDVHVIYTINVTNTCEIGQ